MALRENIKPKFQTNDIPSQADFYEVFDSFVNKEEDKATAAMIDAGTDDEHYVTPALLRVGLQNAGVIAGGSNLPYKQHEDNFNASFINLDREPIESSVKVFKNGQLLQEDEDYTINYETAIVTFPESVGGRNIEIDYWYRSLDPIPGNGTNYVDLTTNQTIGGDKTFTGSVQVPNATLSTEAVNKGQLDAAVLGGGGGATPTFQQVLDTEGEYPGGQAVRGTYSYLSFLQEDGDGNVSSDIRSTTPDFSKLSYLSLYHNQAGLDHIINNGQPNSIAGSVTILEGKPSISQEESSGKTTLQFESPTANATIKIPAKPAGTYTIATLDDITGGSTNLSTTYSPTTVTIESSNGTDAVVNAVDVTNAGVVTPTQKADWDAKQDALGFTPYNATNPANYQTNVDVANTIGDFIVDSPYDETLWNGVTDDAPSLNSVRDKFVSVDSDIALKANLNSPTFTGSVQVPNATLSTEAVNKGQLDAVASAIQQYKTYFINTATGNNATGVYQDASKPFASIDYVNANFTIQDGDIFYLQGTGQTYVLNGQLPFKKLSIVADRNSTNILDFSNNANANISPSAGANTGTLSISIPNGKIRCERNGGTGVIIGGPYPHYAWSVNIDVNEIYWNTSSYMLFTGNLPCTFKINKNISCRSALLQITSSYQDIYIPEFVCLANGATFTQSKLIDGGNGVIRIGKISGSGSYSFWGPSTIVGDISTTGVCQIYNSGENIISKLHFENSTITGGGFLIPSSAGTDVVMSGRIKSISSLTNATTGTGIIRFVNFSADLGTSKITVDGTKSISFENCSIKSTNSPLGVGTTIGAGNFIIRNSTFEVVNAVPLMTGGVGGTRTLTVSGLSTNATMLSDQNGTGVTVNVIGKQSVATAVNPNDAVTKAQLDAAVIGGGVTDVSATFPILSTGGTTPVLSHATTDGNLHVPATGTTNNGKVLTAGASAGSLSWVTPVTSPLVVINDGNGNGYRLSNANPLNFGNIGADAIDFSYSETPSSVFGATGSSAFAMGSDVIASNYSSTAFGYLIDNNGIGSFDSGFNLKDRGYTNSLFGIGHDVTSMNTTVVGQASNVISDQILDFNSTTNKKLFVVGNGTIQNADNSYTVNTRSDALIVRLNGAVEAPSLTNAIITADTTGKTLVTKGYVGANYTKFGSTAPSSATDTGIIGEVRITSTYVYYCIATNTWVRAALATW